MLKSYFLPTFCGYFKWDKWEFYVMRSAENNNYGNNYDYADRKIITDLIIVKNCSVHNQKTTNPKKRLVGNTHQWENTLVSRKSCMTRIQLNIYWHVRVHVQVGVLVKRFLVFSRETIYREQYYWNRKLHYQKSQINIMNCEPCLNWIYDAGHGGTQVS